MGWGFLMGLGQGLTQLGGMMDEKQKMKLADKLEQDKEARANKRADLVYNREQMSFDHEMWAPDPASVGDPGGEVMRIYKVNKAGDKYGEGRLPSQDELQEHNRAQQTANISLQNAILGNKKTQLEIDNMPQEQADKHALSGAQADYYSGRNDTSLANTLVRGMGGSSKRGALGAEPISKAEAAQTLVSSYPALIKSYTTGDSPIMSQAQVQNVAEHAVATAAARNLDAAQLFTDMLARIAAKYKGVSEPLDPYTKPQFPETK